MGIRLHASMVDTACCVTVDIRVFSRSVDTSWYHDTCMSDSNGAARILTSAFHCVVTVTEASLRAHGILIGKIESVAHEPTVSNGIDRVTVHELLLWLTSDVTLRSCLQMLRFLVRERDDYCSVSEIKLDLRYGCCVVDC